MMGPGLEQYARMPELDDGKPAWKPAAEQSAMPEVLRGVAQPFAPDGGLERSRGRFGKHRKI